jgi:hypothetical protein
MVTVAPVVDSCALLSDGGNIVAVMTLAHVGTGARGVRVRVRGCVSVGDALCVRVGSVREAEAVLDGVCDGVLEGELDAVRDSDAVGVRRHPSVPSPFDKSHVNPTLHRHARNAKS